MASILILDGHPDPAKERFGHALAEAYGQGAEAASHSVRLIRLAETEVPVLRSAEDWSKGEPAAAIRQCQEAIAAANHLVIIHPLWLGAMPALLKAFFEQAFRPGFALEREMKSLRPGLLGGRSARIIVTMGMPAWLYRWFFRAHSLKSLERNILRFSGIKPVRETLIGSVEAIGDKGRRRWLDKVRELGRQGR